MNDVVLKPLYMDNMSWFPYQTSQSYILRGVLPITELR